MAKEDKNTQIKQRRKGRPQTNPNSLANLKPFQKGESGNPNGKPEGSRNLSTLLKEMLAVIAPDEIINSKFVKEFCKGKKSVTNADALTARLISEGIIKGESWAIREILDRTEGKAAQNLHLSGADGGAITTQTTVDWSKLSLDELLELKRLREKINVV